MFTSIVILLLLLHVQSCNCGCRYKNTSNGYQRRKSEYFEEYEKRIEKYNFVCPILTHDE